MSSRNNEDISVPNEIVIIRRRPDGEDGGHHGGVWKIAYADFMTAMMAFFLVMWLINAADKKTVTQVANYFNPMRLTDRAASSKGIHDVDASVPGQEDGAGKSKQKDAKPTREGKGEHKEQGKPGQKPDAQKKKDAGQPRFSDQALMNDPYGTLAKLADEAQSMQMTDFPERPGGAMNAGDQKLTTGEAFRDPFDPRFRQGEPGRVEARPGDSPSAAPAADPKAAVVARQVETDPVSKEAGKDPSKEASKETGREAIAVQGGQAQTAQNGQAGVAPAQKEARAAAEAASPALQADRAALEAQIKAALEQGGPGKRPHVDVKVTPEGLLVSLTDEFDFSMFAIASAEPRPEVVVYMERVAKILAETPGQLVVRGHTDGRPFRSGTSDNWRLSSARAQIAYYMLVRGGIDEKRFERIEGHADRSLKIPSDPDAAQNRRIEILLRSPKS
jgi:chemotaxis protein MotB